MGDVRRCSWATSELMIPYHDNEWGRPVHDDAVFFEFLTLEGAQAGLSWETILAKRARYRVVFTDFDPARVARFTPARIERVLGDAGIVRNRAKVESTVGNARAFLALQKEFGSFDRYVWRFVDGKPIVKAWKKPGTVPAQTPQSEQLSKDLRKRGFRFVGPTIMYAFMQATGLVNDHLVECDWHDRVAGK